MAEIQRVTVKHEAIMDYMISNPLIKLGDVAIHFGFTPGWLSQVIHSDAFQAQLQQKQGVIFNETVLPLREKMENVAHAALDRLAEQIPKESDVSILSSAAGNVLDRLGFGSKPNNPQLPVGAGGVTVQVNVLHQEISEARALMGTARAPVGVLNGSRPAVQVQRENPTEVGQALEVPTLHAADQHA